MTYDLIIFDIDGILADRESGDLLPGRRDFFINLALEYPRGSGPKLALVSIQVEAKGRVYGVAREIQRLYTRPAIYQGSRKPEMLLQAMIDADVSEARTVMVGDLKDREAREAARMAGCAFVEADEFFEQYNITTIWSHRRNILRLLDLYLTGELPKGITLVYVKYRKTDDGQYRLVRDPMQPASPPPSGDYQKEQIKLEPYTVDERTILAGYGEVGRILMIGEEVAWEA